MVTGMLELGSPLLLLLLFVVVVYLQCSLPTAVTMEAVLHLEVVACIAGCIGSVSNGSSW